MKFCSVNYDELKEMIYHTLN